MHIIRRHQFNAQLFRHLHQLLIHKRLLRDSVILQLQKIIPFSEDLFIFQRLVLRFVIQPFRYIALYFPCQTRAQRNDPLAVRPEYFLIHPRLVIISLHKSFGNDLHQIRVPGVILRQQNQMIVSVFPSGKFSVKPGVGRHIDLASEDRFDAGCFRRTIKIDHAVHHAMIGDRRAVHPEFFHPPDIFFDLV